MRIQRKDQSFRKCLMGLSAALCGLSVAAADREFFVAPEGDDDKNDGLGWASPFKTIQKAIDQQESGEYFVVTVSNGTYLLDEPILLKSIGGGIHLRSFSGNPADVIIDGGNRCACLWSPHNQQRSWYEGLTFQNGLSEDLDGYRAGGLYANQRCFVTNCVIRNCSHVLTNGTHNVQIRGGGAMIYNQSTNDATVDHWNKPPAIVDTLVENCSIVSKTSNDRVTHGGGVYANSMQLRGVTIQNCAVTNDTAGQSLSGGGLYASCGIVSNCTIVGNCLALPNNVSGGARGTGAGAYVSADSSDPATGKNALVVDSVVADNLTSGDGAGLTVSHRCRVVRVAITNNVAISPVNNGGSPERGGALRIAGESTNVSDWTVVEDCLVEGNEYRGVGSWVVGVTIYEANCVRLSGTVIRNNRSSDVGGLNIVNCSDVVVTNCVITGNQTTNSIPAVRLQNNIFKVKDGTEIPANANRSNPVQFVDTFIVANTNSRPASLQNGGGIFQCNIGNLATKDTRIAYITPVVLRNCLIAGNEDNIGKGWCFRFGFAEAQRLAYFEGRENRPVVIEHCTVAGNRNRANNSYNSYAVIFTGSSKAADSISLRDTVFADNLYNSTGASPKKTVIYNEYSTGTPEVIRSYGDQEDDCLKVTPENGNIVGGELCFADAAHGNYAIGAGSCLVDKGGAFADWMGNGRRNSPSRDLSGGYVISANGPYGVAVTRPNSNPRRCGAASDIGCCEFWMAPGVLLFVR